MLFLIDNGHGAETRGKRSPDCSLQEWLYTRQIARKIVARLRQEGIPAKLLVPEIEDIPLRERVRRANELYRLDDSCMLVSVHVNASGVTPQWRQARGWSVFVAQNASLASRQMASALAYHAQSHVGYVRRPMPDCDYWTQSLAICRDTRCPAVLTENLFMDNTDDCRFLLSDAGRQAIVDLHVEALRDIYDS